MQAASRSAPPPAPAAPTATEIVTRPAPGLARGQWEAPAGVFWAMLGVILVGALVYVLRRMGLLNRAADQKKTDTPPPSRGNRR
jgi:hypothetical protein